MPKGNNGQPVLKSLALLKSIVLFSETKVTQKSNSMLLETKFKVQTLHYRFPFHI